MVVPVPVPEPVQFGGALMLALVTAVNVIMTRDDPTRATLLAGYQAAPVVPLVGVAIGAAITAAGLRRPTASAVAPSAAAVAEIRADAEAA
jgi:hypothetical protein